MEQIFKKNNYNKKTAQATMQKALVVVIGTAGFALILTSPMGSVAIAKLILNVAGKKIAHILHLDETPEEYEQRVRSSLYRLKKNNYIKETKTILNENETELKYELTKKGKELLKGYSFHDMEISKPEKWDKKWRFVIFDIPEKHRYGRDILRDKIKRMGFFQIQQSVWMYPYPIKKEMDFILEYLYLQKYVLVFETKLENDKKLKQYFRDNKVKL